MVTAAKAKFGRAEALKLARSVDKVIVAKGAKVETFNLKNDAPRDANLLKAMLGPTGNLRAPTIRRGQTLLVGFNEEVYAEALG